MFCLGSAFLGHLQAMVMAELFQQVLKTPKYRANTFRLNFTCIHRCMYRSTIILNAYLHICGVLHHTVDGRKSQTTIWDVQNPVNNGMYYQPQLVNAGFLNHQQYHFPKIPGTQLSTHRWWCIQPVTSWPLRSLFAWSFCLFTSGT